MKQLSGKVSSNKMTGVVTVIVEMFKIHPLYKKRLRRTKKYLVSTREPLQIGDEVIIRETRPQSKRVAFMVDRVVLKSTARPVVRKVEEKIAVLEEVKDKVAPKKSTRKKEA